MAQTTIPTFDPQDVQQNKTMAGLALFGVLFFLPLVSCPNSAFGRWAANQGLLVLITSIILSIVNTILAFIPIIGWLLGLVLGIGFLVFALISMIAAFQGQAKPLPVVGGITLIK